MADEQVETVQLILPKPMAAWLKSRAVRHDRSISAEGRSVVFFAMQAENLLGKTDVVFATAPVSA
jgi:plasmid stability protein